MGRFAVALVLLVGCGSDEAAEERPATPPIAQRGPPLGEASRETGTDPETEIEPTRAPQPLARALVKLIVLGDFPEELTDAVEAGLRAELQVDVERIEGVPLPEEAWYPARRRYRADRLLEFLNEHLADEPQTTRVLGMTSVDISTTKPPYPDWGVFGLGELGGRSCVISTFRLTRRARDDEHRRFRVVTTAIHEVGHTLGLEHCTEATCVMRDAEGSVRTVDTSSGRIEPECLAELDLESPPVLPYREPR